MESENRKEALEWDVKSIKIFPWGAMLQPLKQGSTKNEGKIFVANFEKSKTFDSKKKKKRRRSDTVSLACVPCRLKHAKCDGNTPVCGRCEENKVKCEYLQPSRRGPKKKEETIKIEEVKEQEEQTESKEIQPIKKQAMVPSKTEVQMQQTNQYNHYILSYKRYVEYFIGIPAVFLENSDFDGKSDIFHSTYMRLVLANGALAAGDVSVASNWAQNAHRHMSSVFYESNDILAGCHALLGLYYRVSGDLLKSHNFFSLAESICRNLGVFQPLTHRVWSFNSIAGELDKFIQREDQLACVKRIYESSENVFRLLALVYMSWFIIVSTKDAKDLVVCQSYLNEASCLLPSPHDQKNSRESYQFFIESLQLFVHHRQNQHELAMQKAFRLLKSMSEYDTKNFATISGMIIFYQFFKKFGSPDTLKEEFLPHLQDLFTIYPLLEINITAINNPKGYPPYRFPLVMRPDECGFDVLLESNFQQPSTITNFEVFNDNDFPEDYLIDFLGLGDSFIH